MNEEAIKKMTKGFSRKQNVKLAIYSAELVLPIFEKQYPKDNRPRKAIAAAKKCIESDTKENRIARAAAANAAAANAVANAAAAAKAAVANAAVGAGASAAANAAARAVSGARDEINKNIRDYAVKLSEEK